jgi:hypothetical protein
MLRSNRHELRELASGYAYVVGAEFEDTFIALNDGLGAGVDSTVGRL